MGIKEVLSTPRSPWERAFVERVIGAIRRECLDHVIVFNEVPLHRHVRSFLASITSLERTSHLLRIHRSPGPCSRRHAEPLLRYRKSAAFITGTSGTPLKSANLSSDLRARETRVRSSLQLGDWTHHRRPKSRSVRVRVETITPHPACLSRARDAFCSGRDLR